MFHASRRLLGVICAAGWLMMSGQPALALAHYEEMEESASPAVPMLSGGIGEEMDTLKSVEHEYDLKLLFTEGNGMYLSDAQVRVEDLHGHVIADTTAEGPVLLLNLPAGKYKIFATEEGQTLSKVLSVSRARHRFLHEYQFRFITRDTEKSE